MRVIDRKLSTKVGTSMGYRGMSDLTEVSFDSVSDIMATMRTKPRGMAEPQAGWSWTGTSTVEEVFNRLEQGSPELLAKMMSMVDALKLPDALLRPELTKRRKRMRGDFGNELDIHAVRQGRMDRAWDRTVIQQEKKQGSKLVHLVINMGAHGGVYINDMMWRAAAVMRIYEALVSMGKSVAVTGLVNCGGIYYEGVRDGMITVKLKDYGTHVDPAQLAATMHGSFYRAVCLPAITSIGRRYASSYGSTFSSPDIVPLAAEEDRDTGGALVYIDQCWTKEAAMREIDKFIAQFASGEETEALSSRQLH